MQYHSVSPLPVNAIIECEQIRSARQGDEYAFLAIYHRHRRSVFQFAWRMTRSQSAAEDIVQECFLALMQGAAFNSGRGELRTYLYGIARNLVFRRLKISEREAEESIDIPAAIDTLDDLISAERSELIASAIARLPILQREAIVLFTYEELRLEEIARIAKIEAGAVKSRLHRARESLRAMLTPLLIPQSGRRPL
jgi:RNA polymerase sigma-70 factor (ECF subfamily)